MSRSLLIVVLLAFTAGLVGCDSNDESNAPTTFTVRVENVSTPGLLTTDRAGGAVPVSPGVFVVFTGSDPAFTVGQPADGGTELIAEDGFPSVAMCPCSSGTELESLQGMSNVSMAGTFAAPGGTPDVPALFPGETATFTITASPGERLQIETMFVQSNDWFYAFGDGGLDLFDGDDPTSGDVTGRLVLYDAGTEEDTAPGTGPEQKPVQDPNAVDVGTVDDNSAIRPASDDGFSIPATASVIRVTITPAG